MLIRTVPLFRLLTKIIRNSSNAAQSKKFDRFIQGKRIAGEIADVKQLVCDAIQVFMVRAVVSTMHYLHIYLSRIHAQLSSNIAVEAEVARLRKPPPQSHNASPAYA